MRTVRFLDSGVTHESRPDLSDGSALARCGSYRSVSRNYRKGEDQGVDCHDCLALAAVVARKGAMGRLVHWISPGECSVWQKYRGTCTSATAAVTCDECKAFPGYRARRLVHVSFALDSAAVHLSTDEGVPACGFTNPVNIDTDLAIVTCLECLRSITLPELESQPTRRILLDEND